MRTKKQIKIDKEYERKRKNNKSKLLFIVSSLIFIFAIGQAIMLFIQMNTEPGHNKIILGDRVVTTEVCTKWFNSSMEYPDIEVIDNEFMFMFKYELQIIPIPTDVVVEVCNKWKTIKEEIDLTLEKTLCERYTEQNKTQIEYINGSQFVNIEDKLININFIKENCLLKQ